MFYFWILYVVITRDLFNAILVFTRSLPRLKRWQAFEKKSRQTYNNYGKENGKSDQI